MINVNGEGGTINTTLRATGGGVDVTSSAHDVDLGGDVVNGSPQPQTPPILWNPVVHPMQRQPIY